MFLPRVNARQVFWIKKGCSIEEVMKEFHSIEEVVFGSELYCFATEFLWLEVGGKCGQQLVIWTENFSG